MKYEVILKVGVRFLSGEVIYLVYILDVEIWIFFQNGLSKVLLIYTISVYAGVDKYTIILFFKAPEH